jgi:hypothetical protein
LVTPEEEGSSEEVVPASSSKKTPALEIGANKTMAKQMQRSDFITLFWS